MPQSPLFDSGQKDLFSPLIDVVANGMAAMFVILMVYMALFRSNLPAPPIEFLDTQASPAICGTPYMFTVPVVGGGATRHFSVVTGKGALPPSLALDGTTGTLYGTPACSGTSMGVSTAQVEIQVTSNSTTVRRTLSVDIHPGAIPFNPARPPSIQTLAGILPVARAGVEYSLPLGSSGSAEGIMRWAVATGSLPHGMTLREDGVLVGTPADPGQFSFEVSCARHAGSFAHQGKTFSWNDGEDRKQYTLEVLPAGAPTVDLPIAQIGERYVGAVSLGRLASDEKIQIQIADKGITVGEDGYVRGMPQEPGTHGVEYSVFRAGQPVYTGKATLDVLPARHVAEIRSGNYVAEVQREFRIPLAISGLREPVVVALVSAPAWSRIEDRYVVGIAPKVGSFELDVSAEDPMGKHASGKITLNVIAPSRPLLVETPSMLELSTGSVQYTLSASGGDGGYFWTADSTAGQLSITPGGVLQGYVSQPRETQITATIQDRSGNQRSKQITLKFRHPQLLRLRLATTELPPAVLNIPYRFDFAAEGAVGRATFEVTGALPAGIKLGTYGLVGISGQAGAWPIKVRVTDEKGQTYGPVDLRLSVVPGDPSTPRVVTDTLPPATVGHAYVAVLAAEGGLGAYRWDVRGATPPGFKITPTGFTGTPAPAAVGDWRFQVLVTDQARRTSHPRELVLSISSDAACTSTPAASSSSNIDRTRDPRRGLR